MGYSTRQRLGRMSYCINLDCAQPKNPPHQQHCQSCGSSLLLRGRYRAVRALGRGGFGATFLARDEQLPGNPACVIKQLRPSAGASNFIDMARDLFKREAKILGMIGNHPQLPRLLDYFEQEQEFFLVQEFINGVTLQQEVRRGGPFSEAGVKQFLTEILPMVQYVHSNEVIHRDIKPANIIRRQQDKRLVLIDFGAVKDKVNPAAASSDQTALTAYAIGTPGYAPPEQMAMRPVYASDIYALGVTCVFLLSGKSPRELDYDPTTGEMRWREQVHISDHLAKVLDKMLSISVRHRYQSTEAIHRDLDLAPYMDSLAQNMAFQAPEETTMGRSAGFSRGSVGPASAGPSGGLSGASSGRSSGGTPAARMAAAIRARRERGTRSRPSGALSPTGGTTVASRGRQRPPANPSSQGGTKGKSSGHLTGDQAKELHARGRRDFSQRVLRSLDWQRASLTDLNFNQAKLPKANFQGTDLSRANFGKADLSQATLRNACLERAYFNCANLQGADFRGANLAHACLSSANLRGANLCGADLTGAIISDEQLATARTNWSTIYPNGKRGFR